MSYWFVAHEADLTETGLFTRKTYIKTIWQGDPENRKAFERKILEDFCRNRFGKMVGWVQGKSPTTRWMIRSISEEEYNAATPIRWGGVDTETKKIAIGIGNEGKITSVLDKNVKLYKKRDTDELDAIGLYFSRHMQAMEAEGLTSKEAIAAELAHRDLMYDTLVERI